MFNLTITARVMWASYNADQKSLNMLVSAKTGQKAKEGEKYPPSVTFSVYVKGAYAEVHQNMAKGDQVLVWGGIEAPEYDVEKGQLKPISFRFPSVELLSSESPEEDSGYVKPAAKSKKTEEEDLGF